METNEAALIELLSESAIQARANSRDVLKGHVMFRKSDWSTAILSHSKIYTLELLKCQKQE